MGMQDDLLPWFPLSEAKRTCAHWLLAKVLSEALDFFAWYHFRLRHP
jgi:hypothetical protein